MANENGWGDGASNNNIGWGQGAINNSISWGAIHSLSAAGLTDIVGQTFQPESVAYFTAIEDAGGTLTDNVKAEFDAFVLREKDAGRWDKLKRLYPFLGGKINSAIIDAVTTNAATNNNFVDGDVDNLIGITGDNSTKSLVETEEIKDILIDDYSFSYGIFTSTPMQSSSTSLYQTEYFDGSNRIGLRRVFDTIGGYYGPVSSFIRDSANHIGESNYSFIFGQYSNNNRSLLFNGLSVVTNTTTSLNPTSGFTGGVYKYKLYNINYDGEAIGNFMAVGMSESELISFESSYKTFINNITA